MKQPVFEGSITDVHGIRVGQAQNAAAHNHQPGIFVAAHDFRVAESVHAVAIVFVVDDGRAAAVRRPGNAIRGIGHRLILVLCF